MFFYRRNLDCVMGVSSPLEEKADLGPFCEWIYSKIQDSNYDLSSSQKYVSDWVSTYGDGLE